LTNVPVRTDATDVAAFAAAIDAELDAGEVPFTYPIRWLAEPKTRQAISDLLDNAPGQFYLDTQTFTYAQPLQSNHDYRLDIMAHVQHAEIPIVTLSASVADACGNPAVVVDCKLGFVHLAPDSNGAP
jgi:hypothetical protein